MSYEYVIQIEKPMNESVKNKIIDMLKKHPKLDMSKMEDNIFSGHFVTVKNTQPGWWDLYIEVSNERIFINRTDSSYVWKDIEEIKNILDKECKYEVDEP